MASLRRGEKVGEGTYGAVYNAQLPGDRRALVVKRNFSHPSSSFIQNVREADILNRVKGHPHIVEILHYAPTAAFEAPLSPRTSINTSGELEIVHDDALHFIFPKSDEDLHTLSNRPGVPGYAALKKYMAHMLLGVEHIHQKTIVHFDIKPSNILINSKLVDAVGNVGVAQICDFGLARPFTYQEPLGANLCTAIFRPPELMMWRPNVDFKVDIWSMACCFFQAITKRHYIPSNFCDLHPTLHEDDALIAEYIKRVPGGLSMKYRRMILSNNRRKPPPTPFTWPDVKDCPVSLEAMLNLSSAEKIYFEAQAGPLSQLCDLMEHMMEFDPRRRYSATECLDHPFFNQYRELINNTRTAFVANIPIQHKVYSHPCIERRWGSTWLYQLYVAKQSLSWYHDRVVFQAWDLYERYLYAMSTQLSPPGFAVESDLQGFIHSKSDAYLRFLVCLYISIKYFNHNIPGWSELVKQIQVVTKVELAGNSEFLAGIIEFGLISECLHYTIYCPTVYESADWHQKMHSPEDLARLLMLVNRCPNLHGRTVADIYQHYTSYLSKHPYDQFHIPITWPAWTHSTCYPDSHTSYYS